MFQINFFEKFSCLRNIDIQFYNLVHDLNHVVPLTLLDYFLTKIMVTKIKKIIFCFENNVDLKYLITLQFHAFSRDSSYTLQTKINSTNCFQGGPFIGWMKHWNSSETANVCGNCGFQTFSLPVYKRHSKHCSGDPLKIKEMSCEFLNGSMKEPLHTISSKEFSESSSAIKSQPSLGKNLLYCKLCEFSCSFSSQLINHIKRVHSNESRGHQEHISSDLNLYEIQMNDTNGVTAIKSDPFLEAEELGTKKKIVLKKIKLEIPTGDGNLSAVTGKTKESLMAFEANLKTLSSPTSVVTVNLDTAEDKSRKCPECGFVAKNRDQLLSHKASHEASDIIYACSECEYKTPVRKNFERHEWCHIVDSPFKCQFCSFSSNGENAIKRHVSAYHTLQKQQTDDRKSSSVKSLPIPPSNSNWTVQVSSELLDKSLKIEPLKKKTLLEKAPNQPVSPAEASVTTVKLEAIDSSSFVPSCSTASSSILQRQLKPETQGFICPHCGLCYKENFLLEHHIKASHQKLPIQINNLTNRPLIQHDQKQLKKLEVSHMKQKSEIQQEPKASLRSQTKGSKSEQRIEIKMEEVRKVYKCGYCSFSVNEFSKLREHMESNACQPLNTSTSTISATATAETVLQKLLTNDNPNKVYPKVPLSSFISRSPTYLRSETQAIANSTLLPEVKFKMEASPRPSEVSGASQSELSIHPRENPTSPFHDSTAEESIKVSKTYICCLLCTYKTLSSKVLRKHLIRDHASIICSKKILRDVVQKSIMMSIRQVGDNRQSQVNNWESTAQKTEVGSFESLCSNDGESEVLLQMDVQCESENNPPAHLQEKKVSKQTAETSKFMPFKCSECGKRSNWKHVIKKHISDKHLSATVLTLSPEDAESSYNSYHDQIARRLSSKMMANRLHYNSDDINLTSSVGAVNFTNGEMVANSGMHMGLEDNLANHDLDPSASEQLGMSDLLRLKRFKCSVCIYRSNFRCDISRHLKKRHPDVNCYYSVMSLQEAKESLPHYRYTWPEAEALLLASSSVKDENAELKTLTGDANKINPAVERKAAAIVSRLPFGSEEGKRCPICPFITNKAELLRLHMAYHQPQKRNCYSCPHCPYFVNTSRLLQHHITLHENDQFIKSVAAEKTATQQLNAYNLEFNYVKRWPFGDDYDYDYDDESGDDGDGDFAQDNVGLINSFIAIS